MCHLYWKPLKPSAGKRAFPVMWWFCLPFSFLQCFKALPTAEAFLVNPVPKKICRGKRSGLSEDCLTGMCSMYVFSLFHLYYAKKFHYWGGRNDPSVASLLLHVFFFNHRLGIMVLHCILHLGNESKSCKVRELSYGKSTKPPTQSRMLPRCHCAPISLSPCVTSFWEITPELLWAWQTFCHMWVLRPCSAQTPCSCLALNWELRRGREL